MSDKVKTICVLALLHKEVFMVHKVVICGINTNELPKIDKNTTDELLKKSKNGDKQSKDLLVMSNIRLVLSIVQRFNNKGNSDDLFQVGMVGLLKAIDNFDCSFNVRFSTYAVPMIIGEIRRFLKDSTGIKVSRSMRDTAYKVLKAKELYEKNHQYSPSAMEIAKEINLPVKEVVCALDAVSEPVYLQDPVFSDGEDSMSLEDQIGDNKNTEERWTDNICINQAISTLPEKERKVLMMRYFYGKTQIEISKSINISQAQVSRLEKSALSKMKNFL